MGPLELGTTLSQKYRIVRLMAESGGVVLYEGVDSTSPAGGGKVFVKILSRDGLLNADALERFQREASGSKVLDVGKSSDGLPYMIATDFEGPSAAPAAKPPAAFEKKPAAARAPAAPVAKPQAPSPPKAPMAPRAPVAVATKPPPVAPKPATFDKTIAETKGTKTTLIGVAPPPDHADTPPPSSSSWLSEDALLEESSARIQLGKPTHVTPAPKAAEPLGAPILPSPIASPTAHPADEEAATLVVNSPFTKVAEPPPKLELIAPPLAVEPTIRSEPAPVPVPVQAIDVKLSQPPPPQRSSLGIWLALPLVAALTGLGGWYLGHQQQRSAPVTTTTATPPAPTEAPTHAVAEIATTKQAEPPPPTPTPPPTTAETPPPPPRPTAAVTTATITATAAAPPPHPHPHPPPQHTSSDPLTL